MATSNNWNTRHFQSLDSNTLIDEYSIIYSFPETMIVNNITYQNINHITNQLLDEMEINEPILIIPSNNSSMINYFFVSKLSNDVIEIYTGVVASGTADLKPVRYTRTYLNVLNCTPHDINLFYHEDVIFNSDTRKYVLINDNIKPYETHKKSGIVLNAVYQDVKQDKHSLYLNPPINHKKLIYCDDILDIVSSIGYRHQFYCITSYPYKEAADMFFGYDRVSNVRPESNMRLFNLTVNNTVHDSTGKIVGCLGFNI